ncbi:MAG: MBL fold metallo-hydrolase, partial [Alishewanella sp. 34-51-39]
MSQQNLLIEMFFDHDSCTFSYVVADKATGQAAIIDPVLNYDAAAGVVSTIDADKMLAFLKANNLTLQWVLETHAHA